MRELWAQRGFSPVDLLNLWEPTGAWEEYRGLAYGEGPRRKLDLYGPRHAAQAPVVVFFYDGSWQGGSRDLYPFVGASLAAQGIVTVVPDYSIFPPARFPMFVADAARAVRFARESATQWGGSRAAGADGTFGGRLYRGDAVVRSAVVAAGRPQLPDRSRGLHRASRSVRFPANRGPDLAHHFRRRQ